jgi:hypothetical protein
MVFAVVPDNVTIEEITAAQKRALDEYLGVERRESYFSKFLANENVPVVLGGFVAAFLGVRLAEDIIADLESRVGKVSADVKEGIRKTVTKKYAVKGAPVGVSIEEIIEAFPEVLSEKLPF